MADLAKLHQQAIGSHVDEEAVTVNTRALIDKVLARYSGDWTTLRELIQNAADASAKRVTIRFETLPSRTVPVPQGTDDGSWLKHTLEHHTLHRLIVSNDGQPFADNDWTRLKRIAEGNPDETKIGAFGVGFYSVFADCEEPFVISGQKSMAFLWKGNSLYTKFSTLPTGTQSNQDTTFLLNYRSTTTPIPDLLSVCQFLCTSLTFVGLESIELFLDKWKIMSLTKKSAPGAAAQLPRDIKTKTKEGLMQVKGVVHQSTQIDATWINAVDWSPQKSVQTTNAQEEVEFAPALRSLFSRLKVGNSSTNAVARKAAQEAENQQHMMITNHIASTSHATVFLRISTVNIQASVSTAFSHELERATKKPPPKYTRIAILTSSHDERSASLSTQSGITAHKAPELFSSVLPTKHGRIFIGFPTAQTTGMLCHISAPSVIPTVERESIDLNARYVKTWNIEMLRVAGIACRIAYMGEMEELKSRIAGSMRAADRPVIGAADVEAVTPHALHVFKQYTATESTPSSNVGKLIEEAFWDCSVKASMDVLSTKGVLPSHKVRVISEPLSFVENIPLIPSTITSGAEDFIRRLFERGLVSDMTVKDIATELESRSLGEDQLVEFLKWCSTQLNSRQLDTATIQSLLESAVATIGGEAGGQVLVLSQIKTFLTGSKIPSELPLPDHTIPFKFTKTMTRQQLEQFGWDELQVVPWSRFLVEGAENRSIPADQSVTVSPMFAKQYFTTLSKNWDSLGQNSKNSIIELLSSRTVMPTKMGMRKPSESYFASVKLFDDLATVDLPPSVKEKVLVALGVRKTIELTVVFERLMSQSPKGQQRWSFADLIRYLISVKEDIPKQDIEKLRSTPICPLEEGEGDKRQAGRLCKVTDLFEPKDAFRSLGLPLLYWPGLYRLSGPEGRFLGSLGLRAYPEVPALVGKMLEAAATNNFGLYRDAFKYYIDYHHTNNYGKYDLMAIADAPILQTEGQQFPALSSPNSCFWNEKAAVMGYPVLRTDVKPHAMKFGVFQDPLIQNCASRLINSPPKSHREAVAVFGYLSGRLGEINGQLGETFGNAKFVPIFGGEDGKRVTRYVAPMMCFLGDPQTYGEILDFVDFGFEANSFLLKVGSKNEPSSLELARMVIENPSKILSMLDTTRYLEVLRKLAENQAALKADKALWKDMKQSPFLLGYTEQPPENKSKKAPLKIEPDSSRSFDDQFDEEDASVRAYFLRSADGLVIVDEVREYLMFRNYLCCAPEDVALERFYQALQVPLLGSLLEKDDRIGNTPRDQSGAQKICKLIIERARLFLYDYSGDIRHDGKWLEKNLTVTLVETISRTTTLRGYKIPPYREKKTAALSGSDRKGYNLYVTGQYDLYEISAQVGRILLARPRHNDIMALESVMSSDLRRLRSKGYNVDRILARKEYENRIAEEQKKQQKAEERRRREEEQKRMEEQKRPDASLEKNKEMGLPPSYDEAMTPTRRKTSNATCGSLDNPTPQMPGAFGSPDNSPKEVARPSKKPTNIFSSFQDSMQGLSQQLGLGNRSLTPQPTLETSSTSTQNQNHDNDPNRHVNPVDSERNVMKNLAGAIQACRSHTSNSIFSQPETSTVEEAQGSYCDSKPAQDISYASTSAGGIKVFLANNISDRNTFFLAEAAGVDTFSYILLDLGGIFNLPASTLHIFYEERGSTIAFNQDGALFFNYYYFRGLHLDTWGSSKSMKMDALAYWWITMCHELAHNLVKEHSARHSFYAESFAQGFFGKVMQKALQYS